MLQSKSLPLNQDKIIQSIKQWVEIESPTYDVQQVEKMLDRVEQDLRALPLEITRLKPQGKFAGIIKARYGGEGKGILVLSHIDTVHPVGTAKVLPIKHDGDKLYGAGIYDMKAGAFVALNGFKTLIENKVMPQLPITFIYTPDEEVGSPTSRAVIEEEAKNAAFVLVTEPCRDGGKIVTSRKGVGRYILKVTGVPAHSGSYHQDGRSAINELARQIVKIEKLTNYKRGITATVGMIRGGTAANVVPMEAFADIDIRVPTMKLAKEVEEKLFNLKAITPDTALELTGKLNRPPFPKDKLTTKLFNHAQTLASEMGYVLEDVFTGGGSDGNFTAALGIPTLDGLGCDGKGAHTLHEHIYISSIEKQSRVMMALMETLK